MVNELRTKNMAWRLFVENYFLNDIHRETVLYSVQYKNGCLAATDLFICLQNQLSSVYSITTY